jgi:hypothetical protein
MEAMKFKISEIVSSINIFLNKVEKGFSANREKAPILFTRIKEKVNVLKRPSFKGWIFLNAHHSKTQK